MLLFFIDNLWMRERDLVTMKGSDHENDDDNTDMLMMLMTILPR